MQKGDFPPPRRLDPRIDKADQLSGTLADKDKTLVALIDQSQGVLDLISRRRDDIAAGLTSANGAVGELAGVLDRNVTQLNTILNKPITGSQVSVTIGDFYYNSGSQSFQIQANGLGQSGDTELRYGAKDVVFGVFGREGESSLKVSGGSGELLLIA